MNFSNTRDQVILLGADSPIGLAIIRELSRHGVSVHAVGFGRRSVGLHSRYVASRHIRAGDEESLVFQLDDVGRDYGCRWVMTVGESDILMLQRRRNDFAYVKPLVPDVDAFARVLDKSETLKMAKSLGIQVPRSVTIESLSDIDNAAEYVGFPAILKWANPLRIAEKLASFHLAFEKCRYVYSQQELREYLGSFGAIGELPLLQQYCRGVGLGHMLFMHRGEAVQRFQHLRVAEWPPEGGVSAVCRSISPDFHIESVERSISLLSALQWNGPAMVEYRYDPASGEMYLMEVNGRFWGSLPLACSAGADFAWLAYQAGIGREPVSPGSYETGLSCRYTIPEVKRLARLLFSPRQIQDRSLQIERAKEIAFFIARYFSPKTRYYVFSWKDPKPFFRDIWGALTERLII